MNLDEYAQFARELADASAKIIHQYFRMDYEVEEKLDGSPVTIADRMAEQTMREMITNRYPQHGIIGEEFGNIRPDAEFQWVLDPIDGTKNFIAGSFLFGTLIALLVNGKPILGVIHHPLTNHFLIGYSGKTLLNDKPATVRLCERIEDALVLSSSHVDVETYRNMAAFEQLIRCANRYRTWGDCHGYFLLATGYADVMLDAVMSFWDIAALVPIVEGAGGKISNWLGGDPLENPELGIVAASAKLHSKVISALNP